MRQREVIHHGVVEAAGFFFANSLLSEDEIHRRILAHWHPRSSVLQVREGLLLYLPECRWTNCNRAPGTPLIFREKKYLGLPLKANQLQDVPSGSTVISVGGDLRVIPPSEQVPVDVAQWIDFLQFEIVKVSALRLNHVVPQAELAPLEEGLRKQFGTAVPEPVPELKEVMEALESKKRLPLGIRGGKSGLYSFLRGLFAKKTERPVRRTPGAGSSSWFRLRNAFAKVFWYTGITRAMGFRFGRYLKRMVDSFEMGDLEEAMRRAIPLGRLSGPASLFAGWRLLYRVNLDIPMSQRTGGPIVHLPDDLFTYVRMLYRRAFERLAQQGKIEQAAFVLVELLDAPEEGVDFLEQQRMYRLAAKIAESRNLDPAIIVKQWFLAKDAKRAIAIARKNGAFAAAIQLLEKRHSEEARSMRLLWADHLASAGNLSAAAEAIWPVQEARHLAQGWIDRVIEGGGPGAARMLARKASIQPEAFPEILRETQQLLSDESAERASWRLAFIDTLLQQEPTSETTMLARPALRSFVRDQALWGRVEEKPGSSRLKRLLSLSHDGCLRTDVPAIPKTKSGQIGPRHLTWEASDRGSTAITDAVITPNGRVLLAFGEAGCRLLANDGRTLMHFDQPAYSLIPADNGNSAIALARREDVCRLTRLNLHERKALDWCETRIDEFASDYDGEVWFAAIEDSLYMIDPLGKKLDYLWRIPELCGTISAISRSTSSCSFLVFGENSECWTLMVPGFTVRTRAGIPEPVEHAGELFQRTVATSPEGATVQGVVRWSQTSGSISYETYLQTDSAAGKRVEAQLSQEEIKLLKPILTANWIVVPFGTRVGCQVEILKRETAVRQSRYSFPGARNLSLRVSDSLLAAGDDLGRFVSIDLASGLVLREFRV